MGGTAHEFSRGPVAGLALVTFLKELFQVRDRLDHADTVVRAQHVDKASSPDERVDHEIPAHSVGVRSKSIEHGLAQSHNVAYLQVTHVTIYGRPLYLLQVTNSHEIRS